MSNEMFPPTQEELEQIIKGLRSRLQDDSYQDEWIRINTELIEKEKQLQQLIINENIL